MAVSDRTRKLLWGRSGNRCAICRQELTVASAEAAEALVGEECHIRARSRSGPRGFSEGDDSYENLILLCRTHHKVVDDLSAEYSLQRLLSIKRDHEQWVANTLQQKQSPQFRVYRAAEEPGIGLEWIRTGQDLINTVYRCCGGYYGNDELHSENEAELVADFLQEVEDLDLYDTLEARERVRTEFRLTRLIAELEKLDRFVFAAKVQRTLDIDGEKKPWPVAFVQVLKAGNPALLKAHNTGPQPDGTAGAAPRG